MNGYKLSDDFLNKLMNISAGYIPSEILDSFLNLVYLEIRNHYFTYSSESNLLRIIQAMYDKQSFITDSVNYPHYVEILITISVNSNYLTDILVRNPEYFYRVVNPSHLNKTFTDTEIKELVHTTASNYKTLNGKVSALRSLKRREILRIGLKDILNYSPLKSITLELSLLGSGLTSELFSICYDEIIKKYNIGQIKNSYCIISLGKLGGGELNYSSDIDLIIFYDKDTRYGKKEYRELLTEAVFLFIEQSSSLTGGGYIYRVDFRLRPDGRNAPLCSTLNDYLNYYESRGEDWERQMLIKADYLSGSKDLYNDFVSYLQPFIYPSSFRISPAEQIKKLKTNIENAAGQDNIKLSRGGIRDIEFAVQALQMIHGYKYKKLKQSNTLNALDVLRDKELINKNEYALLQKAYVLYRRIEHYLQLMNDLQTHSIPSEGEMLSKLSFFLGYKNETEFLKEIDTSRKDIARFFGSVTGEEEKIIRASDDLIKFKNKSRAEKDLLYIREGKGLLGTREFDTQSIKAFSEVEPDLLKYLGGSSDPDLVLQNFVRVIKAAGFPSIWYKAFKDKKIFNSFLTVLEFSKRAVDLFSEDIALQEFFLTGLVFERLTEEKIRTFSTKKLLFALSVQFCLKLIKEEKLSTLLSRYFIFRINQTAEEFFTDDDYLIAAMGSIGSKEMSFASDIDLIFAVSNILPSGEQQKIFQQFLQKLKEEFRPFNTDCRLRPEGKSSQLVWNIESYITYIEKRARIWELQAFCRIDYVSGSRKIYRMLLNSIAERLKKESPSVILKEVKDMRKRLYPADISGLTKVFDIKKSPGGLTDVEFLSQYLILCYPDLYKKYSGKKIIDVLNNFHEHISRNDLEVLTVGYNFLKKTNMVNQNLYNVSVHLLPSEESKRQTLGEYLGFESSQAFISFVQTASRSIRKLYDKYMI